MANYDLVLNTRFNPFSYAEMLAPVAAATQAHQALEEEYGNLSAKASIWENMANQQKDPIAYKTYKAYANDLETRADQLLKEGLNASSRKGMLDMRARYSKEIAPIETAYKRREELAAEQRKAYAANPTLRYERYANAMSLDDFIKNPSIDYGRSYSGALLTQQVAQAAANYAKVLTREGKLKSLGLPFQYTKDLGHGATPEQVLAVINKAAQNGEEGAISFLRGIRDQVIASSGTNAWITPGSAAAQERDAFANMGLYSAIGQTEIKDYTDKYNMDNALAIAAERRAADRKKQEQLETEKARQLVIYRNNTGRLFSKDEIANANKATLAGLDKWQNKGYVTKDGKLTTEGWAAINNQLLYNISGAANSNSPYVRARSYAGRDKEFLDWATKHGVRYSLPTRVANLDENGHTYYTYKDAILHGYGDMTNYYNRIRKKAASGELVTGIANIKVLRNRVSSSKETQDNLVNLITSTNSPIYEVGALQENGQLKQGAKFSKEDFREIVKNNPVVHLINSPVGNQQLVELSNGQRFFIPKSVFGESLVNPLAKSYNEMGDLDKANALIRASKEGSDDAIKFTANASAYLSSILDVTSGEDINYHGSITEEELHQ